MPETPPLAVEFLGLPGVGKSSIAVRLGERLAREGFAVAQPSYELAHGIGRPRRILRKGTIVGAGLLRHPLASWRALRASRAAGRQPDVGSAFKLRFNWLLVNAMAWRAAGRPVVSLFDEGLFQGVWSFGLDGDRREASRLVAQLPKLVEPPDVVVLSQADPETVAERVRSRQDNDSRLDRRLDDEPELLQRGAELIEDLCGAIETHLAGRTQLVRVANETDGDLERAVEELAERIVAQIRSQTAATTSAVG